MRWQSPVWGWERVVSEPSRILQRWGLVRPELDGDKVKEVMAGMLSAVWKLMEGHKALLLPLKRCCELDSPQPLLLAFQSWEQRVVELHCNFIERAEKILPIMKEYEGERLREWLDLFIRPAQRITKYPLFMDELSHDASLAGDASGSKVYGALAQRLRALTSLVDAARSRRHCQETAEFLLAHNGATLSPPQQSLLLAQSEMLMAFALHQVITDSGGGPGRVRVEQRELLVFESCLAVLSGSSVVSSLFAARDLSPSTCGPVRRWEAGIPPPLLRQVQLQRRESGEDGEELEGLQIEEVVLIGPGPAVHAATRLLAQLLATLRR